MFSLPEHLTADCPKSVPTTRDCVCMSCLDVLTIKWLESDLSHLSNKTWVFLNPHHNGILGSKNSWRSSSFLVSRIPLSFGSRDTEARVKYQYFTLGLGVRGDMTCNQFNSLLSQYTINTTKYELLWLARRKNTTVLPLIFEKWGWEPEGNSNWKEQQDIHLRLSGLIASCLLSASSTQCKGTDFVPDGVAPKWHKRDC